LGIDSQAGSSSPPKALKSISRLIAKVISR
jgi:hypothetical protein